MLVLDQRGEVADGQRIPRFLPPLLATNQHLYQLLFENAVKKTALLLIRSGSLVLLQW